MIPQARSIEEAKEFFLSNSSGKVLCVKPDGTTKEADCFPDAKAFFEE